MVQIKGSAIKETINQIKSRAGEEALQKPRPSGRRNANDLPE